MSKLGCKIWMGRGVVAALVSLMASLTASCDRQSMRTAIAEEPAISEQGDGHGAAQAAQRSPGLVLDESVPQKDELAQPAEPVEPVEPAEAAPVLEAEPFRVVLLTPRSVKVVWTTPQTSDSEVRYGRTSRLELTPILEPEAVFEHSVLLSGLQPGATYYVQVASHSTGDGMVESPVSTFLTLEDEVYNVRKSHPRIFFNSDDVPVLQKRIVSSHSKTWGDLKRTCEGALGKSSDAIAASGSNCAYARAFAFAGLIGNDSRFKRKAEEIALACARLGASGDKMDVRLRAMATSSVYDWIYADLSASSRGRLRAGMLDMYELLENDSNDHEFVWGHSHGNHRPMVLVALALHGEERKATESVDGLLQAYRNGFFATWRNYGDEGGSLKGWWYTTWTLDMEVEVLAAVASATNVNWFKTETWFEKLVDWYLMGLRSDGTFLRSGDHRANYTVSQFEWIYALCASHYYQSGKAKWLAQKVARTEAIWSLYNVFQILWDDPQVVAEAPSGVVSRHYQAPGQVLLRSSWGSDAVLANFRSASDYTLGHTHLDNNSFTLFYRGGLAINSGMYDEFGSSHHVNYYRRTIAHNSILVMDPNESFTLFGKPVSNDGGQRFLNTKEDGLVRSFPARAEEILDPSNGFKAGGILRFETGADFTYALGDAAASYSKKKVSLFDRHFVWLNSVDGHSKPAVVIFDQVAAKSPSFKKTYLLHTEQKPTVNGHLVSALNNGAILLQDTLLPASPKIEVVGGAGKEYMVQGKNFPTSREPTEKDEVGNWRVEISPAKQSATDLFLNVLYADDADQAAPLRNANIQASGLVGCTVESWAVLFGTSRRGVTQASYTLPAGSWRHLIAGLVSNATYVVTVDGRTIGQQVASKSGMLRFDTSLGGKVEIARTSDSVPRPAVATPAPAPQPEPEVVVTPVEEPVAAPVPEPVATPVSPVADVVPATPALESPASTSPDMSHEPEAVEDPLDDTARRLQRHRALATR